MFWRTKKVSARFSVLIIAVAAPLSACDAQQQPSAAGKVVDEASINTVWHKAKLRGVSFRAIGQEPGWLLEITDGQEILLVTDYGNNRSSLPYVEPVVYREQHRTEFVLEDHGTTIEIRGEPCQDVMSGEEFAVSVTITLPDRTLQGCGRALH
ncbi:MAG: hypothetical protein OET44_07575 [Gammaproteobacteria bacterium]|nr:hypothetical protein [Gammaproteobacteria bacterium]